VFAAIIVLLAFAVMSTTVSAQLGVEKEYTYTDVCFEKDNDGDGLFNEDPIDFYLIDNDLDGLIDEDPIDEIDNDNDGLIDEDPAEPIDNDSDGLFNEDPVDCPGPDGTPLTSLGEPLPIDEGKYIVEAVVKNDVVKSYNPGQYYAVSTVNVLEDVDELTIIEDWCDCEEISALSPKQGGGCVVIVQVGPDDVPYQILDAKSDEVTVVEDECIATAMLGPVSAGTTILMYVKFGPAQKGEPFIAGTCENVNSAVTDSGFEDSATATLELIEKEP